MPLGHGEESNEFSFVQDMSLLRATANTPRFMLPTMTRHDNADPKKGRP